MGCSCGLSIIYIPTRKEAQSKGTEKEIIAIGDALVVESDRVAEEQVRTLLKRQMREPNPRGTIQ